MSNEKIETLRKLADELQNEQAKLLVDVLEDFQKRLEALEAAVPRLTRW